MCIEKESIIESVFGHTSNGDLVKVFTLSNQNGMQVKITNYGGTIISLTSADREGKFENVILAYDTLAEYEAGNVFFGALIGRYGNRIAKGQFKLQGKTYHLAANSGGNHLHGGETGFHRQVWEAKPSISAKGPRVLLSYSSPDGEEGYPGALEVEVCYTLTDNNEIKIDYKATSDKATPVNMTNHSYFNLSGNVKRDILGHHLQMPAEYFTPVDSSLIPSGVLCPVKNTPFDFRQPKMVGDDIHHDHQQMVFASGFDHHWVVDPFSDGELRRMATLMDQESGRLLDVYSTEPGLQFYSGNFLNDSGCGNGVVYRDHHGLCLETQHAPDSPNQPDFPSTILQPGDTYQTSTVFAFSVLKKTP